MKRFPWLLACLLSAYASLHAQTIIANQQLSIDGHSLRLTTHERNVDGFKNTLALDDPSHQGQDDGIDFQLLSLDADNFYRLFWQAADALLQDSSHTQTDFAVAAKAFAGIVLAANSSDERPVAGRLLLKERVLGFKPGALEKKTTTPKYFVSPGQLLQYNDERNEAAMIYKAVDGFLLTSEETYASIDLKRQSLQDQLTAIQDSFAVDTARQLKLEDELKAFEKSDSKRVLEDGIKKIQQDTAALARLKRGNATKQDSTRLLASAPIPSTIGAIDSLIANRNRTQSRLQLELDEGGWSIIGLGRRSNLSRTKTRLASFRKQRLDLQGEIDDIDAQLEDLKEKMNNANDILNANFFLVQVDSVRIEFNQGMIERVVAVTHALARDGTLGEQQIFTNIYPIGFSTQRNFTQTIRSQMLVEGTNFDMIPLGDLISYIPNIRLNTRDFSPADTAVTFFPSVGEYPLHKEARSEVLKARIFSDFVGLSETEPNGLLQTEVEKRINLYTWRRPLCTGTFLNTSFVQFAKPILTLSKLDGKLQSAPVQIAPAASGSQLLLRPYVRTIDLLRFENMSAGLDLNLWLLDSQPWKCTLFLNAGTRFGRISFTDSTRVVDSTGLHTNGVVDQFNANTFRFYPEVSIGVFPDESFNFFVTYRPSYVLLLNDRLSQVPNLELFTNTATTSKELENRWVQTIELAATVRLSERGELYGRYRLHIQDGQKNTNFHQAQVGYSILLTRKVSGQ